MSSVTQRPLKYVSRKRYLGSFFADDYLISPNLPRTFIKGKLESVPSRPEKYHSFINRIVQSFDVLIGKADALYWQDSFIEK